MGRQGATMRKAALMGAAFCRVRGVVLPVLSTLLVWIITVMPDALIRAPGQLRDLASRSWSGIAAMALTMSRGANFQRSLEFSTHKRGRIVS